MDTLLHSQITNLTTDIRSGFERVERQVGDLVTKGEFNATVARLDMKDSELAQQIRDTSRSASESIASGFKTVKEEQSAREQAAKEEATKRESKTRWVIGTVLVVIGLLSPWLKDIAVQALFAQ